MCRFCRQRLWLPLPPGRGHVKLCPLCRRSRARGRGGEGRCASCAHAVALKGLCPRTVRGDPWLSSPNARTIRHGHGYFPEIGPLVSTADKVEEGAMPYRFYDYTLDEGRRELWRTKQLVAVEPKVFQVLLYLLQHRERMVSKEELLKQCWPEAFVSEAALTRCLSKLRKAVQTDGTAPPLIKTLHGHGYRFVADVTLLPPASSPEAVSSPDVRPTLASAESTPVGSLTPAVPPSEPQIRLEPPTPPREAFAPA